MQENTHNTLDILSATIVINEENFIEENTLLNTLIELKGECFFNVFIGKSIL